MDLDRFRWRRDAAGPTVPGAHWSAFSRIWNRISPPLRPAPEDVACYARQVAEWAGQHGPPRALILGVTPELYSLPWPAGSVVTAVDRSAEMIDRVWPGPREAALQADWTTIPRPAASFDVALCDAGLVQVSFPQEAEQVVRSLHRVLRPAGLCVIRLCIPPVAPESPQEVLDHWLSGGIANASLLKLRLGMSLQCDSRAGVPLAAIWDALERAAGGAGQMASVANWSAEEVSTLESYRGNPACYRFPTLSEVVELFTRRPGGFSWTSVTYPAYPLGDRCPALTFQRDTGT